MTKYQMPTETQMYSVVKGDDRYIPRRYKVNPWVALFLITAGLTGLVKLFLSIL